jgi:NAD(P)-dependent dehydrogenase (short-subunit alcohol dehydrogenase family)
LAPGGDLDAVTADDFHAIYAVNVIGTLQTTRACAPMLRAASGTVVNVSSSADDRPAHPRRRRPPARGLRHAADGQTLTPTR